MTPVSTLTRTWGTLQTAWSSVDAGEVLVLITRTDGDDEALY